MFRRRGSSASASAVAAIAAPFGRDVEACLSRVAAGVQAASRRGAKLVVFPESAIGGYLYEPRVPGPALALPPAFARDDEIVDRLVAIAGDTTICVGYTEGAGDKRYSSAVCVSGDGVLGHQRKVHIPAGERANFHPGSGFAAFDTPVGRLGMLLCYDKVFPEAARRLADDGAETIACLAAWPVCRLRPATRTSRDREVEHFNFLDRARAVENQVVWVAANQTGRFGRLRFPGQSKVVDPDGRVLASTGSRAGAAVARIDASAAVRRYREEISHLGDRNPASYLPAPAAVGRVTALA